MAQEEARIEEIETLRARLALAQARIEALETLRAVAQRVTSELQLEALLSEVLSAAVAVVGAAAGSLLLLDHESGELEFAVVIGGAGASLLGQRMPATAGVAGWVVTHGEPLVVNDPAADPRFYPEVSTQLGFPTLSLACVPMAAKGKMVGALEVLNKENGRAFGDDDVSLLLAVASQAAISIENARLYSELAEERDRILAVEQEVRNQLARDLHDGPAQLLASLIMRLRLGLRLLDQGRAEARGELSALEPLMERTLREVRTMLFDLRPVILEARGLVAAIEEYARRQREEGFDVRLSVKGESRRLRQNSERAIFAIVQEAIGNSRKHSGAEGAVIRLSFEEGWLGVEVHDDGVGFDVKAVEASYATRGSLGLLNMRERAEAIGGQLTLSSKPGQGTSIHLSVPV
ncbi:MAG: GAF domain-containing sensor histidine kinase [Anaerolineae bacterium]|nr:GAF domain-containing sensor histidine kinase [Anaerolineae bacterium]